MNMKIVDITPCYRITMENDVCGVESYIDVGSKLRITFDSGAALTGYIVRVEYGDYPKENDMLIISVEGGRLNAAMVDRIIDIEELTE